MGEDSDAEGGGRLGLTHQLRRRRRAVHTASQHRFAGRRTASRHGEWLESSSYSTTSALSTAHTKNVHWLNESLLDAVRWVLEHVGLGPYDGVFGFAVRSTVNTMTPRVSICNKARLWRHS